ncbi:WXG100 family type VII secretion target [Micromonospora musae]|uniref:WXG100 family type VII secretion target n=1 Tax=Micromonospora musae TaxID=1894970 RepID=UPI00131532A3|nr:type VII secretion target [Micromonospora musae]
MNIFDTLLRRVTRKRLCVSGDSVADLDAVDVDPSELRGIAAGVAEVGEGLTRAGSTRSATLVPLGGGGLTADAAQSAREVWEAFVRRLGDSVSAVASDLRSAADSYDVSDGESADLIRQSGRVPR